MQRRKVLTFIILVVAFGLMIFTFLTREQNQGSISSDGSKVDFTLPLWETGEEVALSSFYGEDIIVLNLWASWCPPCRNEMPDLVRFYEDYKEEGINVIGVNLSTFERDELGAKEFMEEFQVPFPTYVDQPISHVDYNGLVATLFNVTSIPQTYIIDQNGEIQMAIRGEVSYELLEKWVDDVRSR